MAQSSENYRSIFRLLIWEGLAVVGLVFLFLHPSTDLAWSRPFFYNALYFLFAFPLLFVYRWKLTEGCLSKVLWPLAFLLNLGLGVSTYLWIACLLNKFGSPYFYAMIVHYLPLGILFVFVYFPLIQPLLGISKKYQNFGGILWLLFYSALGGFIGYETGWFLSQKIASIRTVHDRWLLLWLGFTFLGTAIGALIAQRRQSK